MRKKRRCASVLAFLLIIGMVFGYMPEGTGKVQAQAAPASAFGTDVKADPGTLQTWQELAKDTTENVGRIWTDKTVSTKDLSFEGSPITVEKGDSQFLVALSALSSTSNTVTTASRPLDITLVLDVSGSMEDPLGTEAAYVYKETYDISESLWGPAYYAENGQGGYAAIDRIGSGFAGLRFDHWELNGKRVEPKTSAQDTTEGHIQFYTREDLSKMSALQGAVNSFIETTAQENDKIDDVAKQHRISVVKFADDAYNYAYGDNMNGQNNYTQRLNPLTAYTSDNVSVLTDLVSGLEAAGATSADYGLTMAQREFTENGRSDAQKVVIFFTDGEPNHSNGFSTDVANAAIDTAYTLKNDMSCLIYAVGVFEDADPGNTSTGQENRFNAYMHGISSNYPKASAYDDLGDRAVDSAYYKAASDAASLDQIFSEIFEDIHSSSGFPTEIAAGYEPNKGGYVTFRDELGAYMQVDSFKSIVFADKQFDLDPDTGIQTNGNVTTYTFEGEGGNELYPQGNLHDILITVTRSSDLAKGDVVEVRIPAALIPLRHFMVETDENGKTVMDIHQTWPIRILYGASVKPGVEKTLRDGLGENADDLALETYMNQNQTTMENGNTGVLFYSNLYTGENTWPGHDGATLGNTVASFEPAEGNSFYYFTEDTPLYMDEQLSSPLKGKPKSGETYYYQKKFWTMVDGSPVEQTVARAYAGSNFEQASADWAQNEQGETYIIQGSARLTRVEDLTLTKKENVTKTATEVINPLWDNPNNPSTLYVYLGNNGSVAMEVPGALEITKDATVALGKNLDEDAVVENKEFKFQISIPVMKGQTVQAERRNQQGEIQGSVFELTFDRTGNASVDLKDEERLYIHGLDGGADYTVTEDSSVMPEGFSLTSVSVNGQTISGQNGTGTIVGGTAQKLVFTNTYDVTPVTVEDFVPFEKQFDRWDLAPEFQMMLVPDDPSYPMPAGTQDGKKLASVTADQTSGNFGSVTYTSPGIYTYTAVEYMDDATRIAGVDYSMASYDVTVSVSDTKTGALQVDSVVIKQAETDAGLAIPEDQQKTVERAVFTNTFDADTATYAVIVGKNYTDTTGGSLKNGQFQFQMKPRKDLDDIAKGNNDARPSYPNGLKPEADGSIVASNTGIYANFGVSGFSADCIGNTYVYEVTEVVLEGVTKDTPTKAGMTYDLSRYLVKIKVVKKDDGSDAKVAVIPKYYKIEADGSLTELAEGTIPIFANTYDPEDFILSQDGQNAVKGSKVLRGRDSLEQETFSFTLSAANEAASAALANDWIIFEGNKDKSVMTATVQDLRDQQKKGFSFGKMQFSRPGTYQFSVVENAPDNGKGMVYDRHEAQVTVTVTDQNGTLKGTVSYHNGQGASTEEAAFVNTYTASASYGAGASLNISKTLNGRKQTVGEFGFSFQGKTEEAEEKLADTDKAFQTIAPANAGVPSVMFDKLSGLVFTQEDAGKTYSYLLKEVVPKDDDTSTQGIQSKGVTYTRMQYQVDITVGDQGDGTLHMQTAVFRTHDETGAELSAPEKLGTYDSADGKDTIQDISFVNTYVASPVTVDTADAEISLTKQLLGRSWSADDQFDFTLEVLNPQDAPLPMKDGQSCTEVSVTQPEGTGDETEVAFDFGTLTFDKPGIYVYRVKEAHAGEKLEGVTYDDQPATVWVAVTDPGDGQLAAEVIASNTDFVNTYGAVLNHNDAGGIVTEKTLTGRDMQARQFTFQVEALNGTGTTAEENAQRIGIMDGTSGTYRNDRAAADGEQLQMKTDDGDAIVFTQEDFGKTFVYRFSEMGADKAFGSGGTKDGYTYDDTVYTVELWVTDDGDGTMTLHTTVRDQDQNILLDDVTSDETEGGDKPTILAFHNQYRADGITVDTNPVGTAAFFSKTVTGRDWLESDKFRFTVKPLDGAPAPQRLTAEVSASAKENEAVGFGFGTIAFDPDMMQDAEKQPDGTRTKQFLYQVTEDSYDIPGMTPKTPGQTATLSITVTDDGSGKLKAATPVVTNGNFVNVYRVDDVAYDTVSGLDIVKTMQGRTIAKDEFRFTLTAENENAKAKLGEDTKSYRTQGAGFSADGKQSVETISAVTGLVFTQADAGKSFAFTVSEENGGKTIDGVTYDGTVHNVDIRVSDQKKAGYLTVSTYVDGVLAAEGTGAQGQTPQRAKVAFTNRYDAGNVSVGGDADVSIRASKTLTNRPLEAGEFDFVLMEVNGAKSQAAKGTNDAQGEITFDKITYTTDWLNEAVKAHTATVDRSGSADVYTIVYTAAEADSNFTADNGVSGIRTSFAITVKVTDDRAGHLSARVIYPEGMDQLVFENAYGAGAQAELEISGVKALKIVSGDHAPDIAGKYTFTLTGHDAEDGTPAPMPEKTTVVNDASGTADFGKLVFTMEDIFGSADNASETLSSEGKSAVRSKTFTYTVTESGQVAGVVNDKDTSDTITVVVTDNGDGTIRVEKLTERGVTEGADFDFMNTYAVSPIESAPTGDGQLSIGKVLKGRNMAAGEFTFALMDETGKTVAAGSNTEAEDGKMGTVTFAPVTFTAPGTYSYTVEEVIPEEKLGGVEYNVEHLILPVTAVVTDQGDGTLQVVWSAQAENTTFVNCYQAAEASVTFGASKVLQGRKLVAGEFAFLLKDEDGEVAGRAVNTSDGQIVFANTQTFDRAGTYTYTVSEILPEDADSTKAGIQKEGVTYDEKVFELTVTVVDDGKGSLVAQVTGDTPVFINTYEKPQEPEKPTTPTEPDEPDTPQKPEEPVLPQNPEEKLPAKTGDAFSVGSYAAAMMAALAMLVTLGGLIFRRKRR